VRRGDKTEKTLDTGTQKLAAAGTQHLTLKASNISWSRTANNAIVVGGANQVIIHRNPGHSHFVIPIPPIQL